MIGTPTYCKGNSKLKIELTEVDFNELESLVQFSFAGDEDFFYKYQEIKGDYKEMIERNIRHVVESRMVLDLKLYKVGESGRIVGFTVIDDSKSILYSFCINIKYRTKELVVAWVESVKGMLNGYVKVMLWNTNERAINFFKKNGFNVLYKTKEVTYLIFM